MIFFRIFLKRIVSASDFFFKRLCPFWAPLSRAFINVKALTENKHNFHHDFRAKKPSIFSRNVRLTFSKGKCSVCPFLRQTFWENRNVFTQKMLVFSWLQKSGVNVWLGHQACFYWSPARAPSAVYRKRKNSRIFFLFSLCHVAVHFESRLMPKYTVYFLSWAIYLFQMKPLALFIVFSIVLSSYLALVSALSFTLPPGQEKCLREEVHKDVLVTGEYRLSDAPHQKTHLTVSIYKELQEILIYLAFLPVS